MRHFQVLIRVYDAAMRIVCFGGPGDRLGHPMVRMWMSLSETVLRYCEGILHSSAMRCESFHRKHQLEDRKLCADQRDLIYSFLM